MENKLHPPSSECFIRLAELGALPDFDRRGAEGEVTSNFIDANERLKINYSTRLSRWIRG